MFKKILAPLDGSLLSEYALEPALMLAQNYQAELLLVSVLQEQVLLETEEYYDGLPTLMAEPDTEPMRERLESYLASIAESRAGAGVTINTLVLEGDAAGCVVETAVSEQVDLITMGTHGRSGLSRWLLGSVAQKVLRHAPCPVFVIRGNDPLKNMLIPVDHTMLSEQVLDDAFAVAAALNTQIHLFTAITDANNPSDLFDQEEAYLQDLEERYQTVPPRKTAVHHHKPSQAILTYAAENNIDLIVMAPHEHSGIRRWFYKSVTKEVMDGSQCSMLILKPHL